MNPNQCPVCGYANLALPPRNHNICPCCGTQFEADDFEVSHADLRARWQANGMQWYSRRIPRPHDYNPTLQLQSLLGFGSRSQTALVNAGIIKFWVNVGNFGNFKVTTGTKEYVTGETAMNLGVSLAHV